MWTWTCTVSLAYLWGLQLISRITTLAVDLPFVSFQRLGMRARLTIGCEHSLLLASLSVSSWTSNKITDRSPPLVTLAPLCGRAGLPVVSNAILRGASPVVFQVVLIHKRPL
jgi:hypothetical protein